MLSLILIGLGLSLLLLAAPPEPLPSVIALIQLITSSVLLAAGLIVLVIGWRRV